MTQQMGQGVAVSPWPHSHHPVRDSVKDIALARSHTRDRPKTTSQIVSALARPRWLSSDGFSARPRANACLALVA